MKVILYDPAEIRLNLLPLTYTRPVGAMRCGLFTAAERWQRLLPARYGWQTEDYLTELFPTPFEADDDTLYIPGNLMATPELAAAVQALQPGQRLMSESRELARCGQGTEDVAFTGECVFIDQIYHIFGRNGAQLVADIALMTAGRESRPLSATNRVIGDPGLIFLEEGACVEGATLNTTHGPIYIGPDATVMEGACLRGPLGLCTHSQINMGALVYGETTLGPWCKVGGELNNVVMQGFSNKAHDGFLGNAVIGEWCNLGAGCVASNLKNDYTEIRLWNYAAHRFLRTGLQFCGLIMGDHSKAAINTSFNTATTVGVGCNIISEGMPRVFIPSFLKGGTNGFDDVPVEEFFKVARRVMARRGVELDAAHERMYRAIAEFSDRFK